MKANQSQINIIANSVNADSDGGARRAKEELAYSLFPESMEIIRDAIINHPINQRWSEYRVSTPEQQKTFLLPE